MTSLAVRNEIKSKWATLVPTLPLVDADNIDPTDNGTVPTDWARLSFLTSQDNKISIGSFPACWRETGLVQMRVYSKSGIGSDVALANAEMVRAAWMQYTGLSSMLYFDSISPPLDLADGESDGEAYGVQVTVAYTFNTYK
jgi:hypothetical protein